MDASAVIDATRLAKRQIPAKRGAALRPVPPFYPFGNAFQEQPRPIHRIVKRRSDAWRRIDMGPTPAGMSQNQVVVHGCVDLKPLRDRLVTQPAERVLGGTALGLGVAASDIRVHPREPYLLDVLRL